MPANPNCFPNPCDCDRSASPSLSRRLLLAAAGCWPIMRFAFAAALVALLVVSVNAKKDDKRDAEVQLVSR